MKQKEGPKMQSEKAPTSVEQQIIQLEMQALQCWCEGDLSVNKWRGLS